MAIRSRLNSRSSRSWMISRCRRPRKPQRKPKPSAARGLHLVGEAGVVEAQLAHRGAQVLEVGGVDREQAAEHHRLRRLEAGQRRRRSGLRSSVMVSPTRVSATSLIEAVMKPISPGPSSSTSIMLGREDADAVDLVGARRCPSCGCAGPSSACRRRRAPARRRRDRRRTSCRPAAPSAARRASPLGGGRRVTIASSTSSMPMPGLGRDQRRRREASRPITSSICCLTRSGSAAGRSILLRTGTISWSSSMRLVDVGERLRLDALAGVDHQQRALAGGERAVDLVGEVDVAGRVDQVEDVVLAVACAL